MQRVGSSRKAWLKITIFAVSSHFLLPSFFRGKRKGEKNNQSRDFKTCLSAGSTSCFSLFSIALSVLQSVLPKVLLEYIEIP